MKSVSICVVGGGLAGLSAAAELRKEGFKDVIIMEARDRIGGRIHTQQYGDRFIDIGAQYIHGQGSNPIYKIALSNHLLYEGHDEKTLPFENPTKNHFHLSNGSRIDPSLVQETHYELEEILEAGELASLQDAENGIKNMSVGEFVNERYGQQIEQSNLPEHTKHVNKGLMFWRMQMERTETGCNNMDELSMDARRQYDDPVGCDGIVFKEKGYQGILDVFLEQIPESSIKLNCEVETVAWDKKSVRELSKMGKTSSTAVVTTKNDIFYFDYVIITCPLGVLKKHHSRMFKPKLPDFKTTAIESIGFGTVNKIFMEYDEPFWDKDCQSFQLVWRPDDDYVPTTLLSNKFQTEDSRWYQSLHSIDTVDAIPNLLIGWLPGRASQYAESIPEDILLDVCHQLMVKFIGDTTIPRPSKIFRSQWSMDEYSLGSYSYIPKGFTATMCDDLREPLPNARTPCLLFAGEATHAKKYSTTQGALETGRAAAHLIVKRCTKPVM